MDYQLHYEALMRKARGRERGEGHERHHVLPRSLGGNDAKANLVYLTYREHFLAHWLLTKFTTGTARQKMLYALRRMMDPRKKAVVSSWQYAVARKAQSEAMRGKFLGIPLSGEHRSKISVAKRGKLRGPIHTEEFKQKVRAFRHTPEARARISAAARAQHAARRKPE